MLVAIALLSLLVSPETGLDEVCTLSTAVPDTTTSRQCMACHDGSVAPLTHVSFPSTLEGFGGTGQSDGVHPVDVDYEQSSARRPGTLTPTITLAPQLLLPAGLVTCLTCHNPGSREPLRLALPLHGSALCLACHQY